MIKLHSVASSGGFEIPVSKRAMEVAEGCLAAWIPINPKILQTIQHRVANNEYEFNDEKFYRDLRSDLGLYLYTFFELIMSGRFEARAEEPEEILSSIEKFTPQDIAALISSSSFGKADLSQIGNYQAQVLRFVFVASSSAGLMAERANVNVNMTHTLSIFRNLGNLLFSWGYPSVFNRAAERWSLGLGNLTENMENIMKVSILEVLFYVLKNLRLGDQLLSVILNPGDFIIARLEDKNDKSRLSSFEKSLRFCQIGEALARLDDSQNHPLAAREWQHVSSEVFYYLGRHGMELVNERISLVSDAYTDYAGGIFSQPLHPENCIKRATVSYNLHRFNRATNDLGLSDSIGAIFSEVYQSMEFDNPSPSTLEFIFSDVLAKLDFERGGLFYYEPDRDLLVPKYSYGNDEWAFIIPISISTAGELPRLIYDSRTTKTPLRLDKLYSDNVTRSYIVQRFGNSDFEGVLYLGYGVALRSLPTRSVLSCFAAVRQAICDALMIENKFN
jgi:hypothetical protein